MAPSVQFSAPLDIDLIVKQLEPHARILDLGCGYGRVAAQLVSAGFENVIGYDSAPGMIERARRAFPDLALKVGCAVAIPEVDASFDAIVASALLTSVPDSLDRAKVISEIKRLLVPGGFVFSVDFLIDGGHEYDDEGRFVSSAAIEMKHFAESELREMFAEFTDWQCRQVSAMSLSGNSARVLQYAARLPANKSMEPDA